MSTRTDWLLLLLLAPLLGACASFQRHTVVLDHPALDDFRIQYGSFDGCLWRQAVPVHYRLERAAYTLDVEVDFGLDAEPPSLDLKLPGRDKVARFSGLASEVGEKRLEDGSAYHISLGSETSGSFSVEIRQGENSLGREHFDWKRQSCTGLSF
jgi:hypothetical protein